MDLGEARRVLQRVNAETAPHGPKNQQMEDSLLWEACLSLAADYRVYFVTGNKGVLRQPR
jgi:Flp pilus assembly CpaE family ATPase